MSEMGSRKQVENEKRKGNRYNRGKFRNRKTSERDELLDEKCPWQG